MSPTPLRRRRRLLALSGALAASSLVVGAAVGLGSSTASSHREAPLISGTPKLDNTDVYAFVSPDKPDTATIVANFNPFEDPAGGPNFYSFDPKAKYYVNIDLNGDSNADLVYSWRFKTTVRNPGTFLYNTGPVTRLGDADLNVVQNYDLVEWKRGVGTRVVAKGLYTAPANVGTASMPDYASLRTQAAYTRNGVTTFAGQADDPFALDLRVFNLLYGGNLSEVGNDSLKGYNVQSIALQLPVSQLGGKKNIIGIWSSTKKATATGTYVQVSRLGMPLVNEVVIPLKDKDRFNASKPSSDVQFLPYVVKPELPKLLNAVYGLPVPKEPRNDLVQVFLTGVPGLNQPKNVKAAEMLRLNLTPFTGQTFSRLGVIGGDLNGFPNGRRLADDVLDIGLQVVAGELVGMPNDLGDGVDANDVAFTSTFPYVALPHSGSTVR
ncbi:DUF4331 domain-containing protein [Longivirga aurantiaca]|uniref:DUF4331 domain-containing protein n=1 Tax=Longivirga aurantiaca TaxID=1837743 RepID=A0ABW1T372_9ACTN